MTRMNRTLARAAVAGLLLSAIGCATHDARPAFRASVFIDDRGISIPLPPPSVLADPEQDVDVEGSIVGDAPIESGTVVRLMDLQGDADATVELDEGTTSFLVTEVPVNLSDNCLEMWLESADGEEGEHSHFSATVVVDGETESIVVESGCAE